MILKESLSVGISSYMHILHILLKVWDQILLMCSAHPLYLWNTELCCNSSRAHSWATFYSCKDVLNFIKILVDGIIRYNTCAKKQTTSTRSVKQPAKYVTFFILSVTSN